MSERTVEEEYERILQQSLEDGEIPVRGDGPDRREDPRFLVNSGKIAIRVEPECGISDLSISGMAFFSDTPFTPGNTVNIILEDTVSFQALVTGCIMVETDSIFMEIRYRVHCRFEEKVYGKRLLVMMKDMEKLDFQTLHA